MVILSNLPTQEQLADLKGVVDVYTVKGQIRARAWPRFLPRVPSEKELANRAVFATATAWISSNPTEHRVQWRSMTNPPETGIAGLQKTMALTATKESIFIRPPVAVSQTLAYTESPDTTTLTIKLLTYTGFDNSLVDYFFKSYLGEFPHLRVREMADRRIVDNKPAPQWVPVLTDYNLPATITYDLPTNTLVVVFDVLLPGVSWFARAQGISDQFTMLSPLYDQHHRPPGFVRPYYPYPGDPAFPPFFPAGPGG